MPLVEESYRRNPCQSGTYRMGLVLYHFSEGQYAEGLRQAGLVNAPDVVYRQIVIAVCAERRAARQGRGEAIAQIERMEPDYAQAGGLRSGVRATFIRRLRRT